MSQIKLRIRCLAALKSIFSSHKAEAISSEAQAYDALLVLAKAIAIAHSAVPQDIANVLKSERWDEAAGPYEFSGNGGLKKRRTTAKIFKDGKFIEVKEESAEKKQ